MGFARRVFTGGDILWKTHQEQMQSVVDLGANRVGYARHIHRADVRLGEVCGRWWIDTGQRNVQKSGANDCCPQSTRLLSPLPNPILTY